ncbi:MAG: PTS system mannose/fructose/sorbose family transporter subunit IID [Lactimicrobium massiliense]|nr:PTS system mannose/fructose/sorbose family transporter subunit IID [Lactimicrobium massiliense]MDD6230789.1 PTS system mannose/fructose/sorbose family transporter subunit IID [Lactimicrobium massiliense]MDD6458950.1 PTS system mannose/fructose/sorbose family transporter subunit IID [Lactimicrobium massiliense]MDD6560033.1 PTS system mannose/fructose/sorbose family transporter subunit IID [Lactimicrobium massiliense]MDD6726197.1 PTS system mannose/fructose/sorbose family transporter subunit I
MVVGTTPYTDTKEAFPLDKKTLRKIAFRSFFTHAGENAETAASTGWTWAMEPGLKKIHSNPQDLAISLGHNLEFNDPSYLFSSYVMGVVLSLEAQKADPSVIRSLRTTLALAASGLERALVYGLWLPIMLGAVYSMVSSGNAWGVVIVAAVSFILHVILRFVLINVGYKGGTVSAEKLIAKKDSWSKAARISGLFMTGAIIGFGSLLTGQIGVHGLRASNAFLQPMVLASQVVPGLIGLCAALVTYWLLTRKNWSMWKCAILLIAVGFVIGML